VKAARDALFVGLLCLAAFAAAQDEERAEPVSLDVSMLFGSAYREGYWTPVDVVVTNDGPDFTGELEIESPCARGLLEQEPTRRIVVDCPKGSRKRYRVYCGETSYCRGPFKVRLRRSGPRTRDINASVAVSPIGGNDLLALVLAETPSDFSFLFRVGDVCRTPGRFHQIALRPDEFAALPDRFEGYEACDAVILGDIDPNRIGLDQREALLGYVERGGVLVVCPGTMASIYSRSWLADCLGVEMGSATTMTAQRLVEAAFLEGEREGVVADKECLLLEMTPLPLDAERSRLSLSAGADPDLRVKVRGTEVPIAALNPVGDGYVATLAVEPSAQSIEQCEGYLNLWHELCAWQRSHQKNTFFYGATELLASELRGTSFVSPFSRMTLAVYILAYLGAAFPGNWLLCRRFRRPNWAWRNLALLSLAFTAYALWFNLPGLKERGSATQTNVLRLPERGRNASVTTELALSSTDAKNRTVYPAAQHRGTNGINRGAAGMGGLEIEDAVHWVGARGEPISVSLEGFRRFSGVTVRLLGTVDVAGGVEGQIAFDGTTYEGYLENRSGIPLTRAFVGFGEYRVPLQRTGSGWHFAIAREKVESDIAAKGIHGGLQLLGRRPHFVAVGEGLPVDVVRIEPSVERLRSITMVTAPLRLVYSSPLWRDAKAIEIIPEDRRYTDGEAAKLAIAPSDEGRPAWHNLATLGSPFTFQTQVCGLLDGWPKQAVVELYWMAPPGYELVFRPSSALETWPEEHETAHRIATIGDGEAHASIYRIEYMADYDPWCEGFEGVVALRHASTPESEALQDELDDEAMLAVLKQCKFAFRIRLCYEPPPPPQEHWARWR